MNARIIAVAGLAAVLLAAAGMARADVLGPGSYEFTIDFETYGNGVAVNEQPFISGDEWQDLGIRFGAMEPGVSLQLWETGGGQTPSSLKHALFTEKAKQWDNSNYVITFSIPVHSLAFTLIDSEESSPNEYIALYDANDVEISRSPLPYLGYISSGTDSNFFMSFASPAGIAKVVIHDDPTDNDSVGIDDVMFSAPEPGTVFLLALLALHLPKRGGLAAIRRRRR